MRRHHVRLLGAQLRRTAGVCLNEVKQRRHYETKSFDLRWKRSAGTDGRRAIAGQPETQEGNAKDDDILWISKHDRCPADSPARHVFICTVSPTGGFDRPVPRAGVENDANSTTHEQFIRQSAHNDEHCGLEETHAACH